MEKADKIRALIAKAKTARPGKHRNLIFRQLEALTGGGVETKVIDQGTRYSIRTRTEKPDPNER